MNLNNLYSRRFLRIAFYTLVILSLASFALSIFRFGSALQPYNLYVGAGLGFMALLVMTRKLFVRYDSRDELIEIEMAGLFTPKTVIKSKQVGLIKYRVREYKILDRWYGRRLIIYYEKTDKRIMKRAFPMSFMGKEKIEAIKTDLARILSKEPDYFGTLAHNTY